MDLRQINSGKPAGEPHRRLKYGDLFKNSVVGQFEFSEVGL